MARTSNLQFSCQHCRNAFTPSAYCSTECAGSNRSAPVGPRSQEADVPPAGISARPAAHHVGPHSAANGNSDHSNPSQNAEPVPVLSSTEPTYCSVRLHPLTRSDTLAHLGICRSVMWYRYIIHKRCALLSAGPLSTCVNVVQRMHRPVLNFLRQCPCARYVFRCILSRG